MSFHEIAIFAVFIAAVAAVLYAKRKKIVFTGLAFMQRTTRGKAFLDSTARRHPRLWSVFGNLSVIIGVPAMIFISYYIIDNVIQLLQGNVAGAVSLVLPYTTFEARPGLLLVPWYFWVLGIATVVIPHEFCHGILCRLHKIKVDSLGWFLLVIIPGAFVEPNKRSLKRASRKAKLQVYAAGSFANIVTAALFALLGFAMVALAFTQAGLFPTGVIEGTPAHAANLSGAITAINGAPIKSLEDLQSVLSGIAPGTAVTVTTTTGDFSLVTEKHPDFDRSYIGVAGPYQPYYKSKIPGTDQAFNFIFVLFQWLFTINLGIGLFNLLPAKPLDGGLLFEEIISKFTDKSRQITIGVSLVLGLSVIFAIAGPALLSLL